MRRLPFTIVGLVSTVLLLFVGGPCATAQDSKPQTRLYTFDECPATGPRVFDPPPPPQPVAMAPIVAIVVSAVVSPLVDAVVDKGVEALKEAAKDKDFQIATPSPIVTKFYGLGIAGELSLNPSIGCLVIARGVFEEGNFPVAFPPRGAALVDRIGAKFRAVVGQGPGSPGMRLKPGAIEFYFEVVPVLSDNGKVLGFRPQALYVGRFASKDGVFGSSVRNYSFTVTFSDPFGNDPFASADFKYEGIARGFAQEACTEKKASEYCADVELGGIRGWYATMPAADEFMALVKKRQAVALTLETARSPWVDPGERPKVADDVGSVELKLDTLCTKLEAANKPKADAYQRWDDNCPSALSRARRDYLYEQEKEASKLEKQAADAFWKKHCVDEAKNELPKDIDESLIKCLKKVHGNTPELVGRFLIKSTIVETRPGNKVAKFLAPAAEKVAPTLKQAIKEKIDPIEREKAKQAATMQAATDAKSQREALRAASLAANEEKIAQIEYDSAMAALASAPDDAKVKIDAVKAHIALLKAQAAANDANRAAGLEIPFPLVD